MPGSRVTPALRRAVYERAKGRCEYCRSQANFTTESFVVEHIIPRHARGATVLENLALSCFGCNSHKHKKTLGIDPLTGEAVSLFHPRLQLWSEHFAWTNSFTEISGLTAIGRAKVVTLHFNRREVMNLRRVLHTVGEHPPQE
jgi:hypothetical protein